MNKCSLKDKVELVETLDKGLLTIDMDGKIQKCYDITCDRCKFEISGILNNSCRDKFKDWLLEDVERK